MVITSVEAQTKIKLKHMEEKDKKSKENFNICVEIEK